MRNVCVHFNINRFTTLQKNIKDIIFWISKVNGPISVVKFNFSIFLTIHTNDTDLIYEV